MFFYNYSSDKLFAHSDITTIINSPYFNSKSSYFYCYGYQLSQTIYTCKY